MDLRDMSRLAELAEAATIESSVKIAGPDLRAEFGWESRRIGGGIAVRMCAAPDIPVFTRGFALGITQPMTEQILDESLDYLREAGGSALLLQLAPHAETPEVLDFLASRGLVRGRTWAKMMRPIGKAPELQTDLRIEKIGPDSAEDYGHVLVTGFEMPPSLAPLGAGQTRGDGWTAYAAFDGDKMVAVGALFLHEGVAQLAGAATLPSHRGRGAQLALMARRIEDAAGLGAEWVTAETGSETPEEPNPSLRNMRRMGMDELYPRQNWVLRL